MGHWFDNDDFWATCAPFLFPPQRREDGIADVNHLTSLLHIEPGLDVLDLCCGVGRHSIEFARRGYTVTAVDRTEQFLNDAKAQAERAHLEIEFVQSDMREFTRPGSFDVVINLFTSFGYFPEDDDDRKVLAHIYEALRPGGKFVMDIIGREIIARIFRERDWRREGDTIILEERSMTHDWSWAENKWIIIKDGEIKEFEFSHRIYSGLELKRLLQECGFADVKLYGHLSGTPYDQNAERLVLTAKKA